MHLTRSQVNIQNSTVFLYISKWKVKIKTNIIYNSIRTKYLGIGLTKYVQNLHSNINITCSWIRRLNNVQEKLSQVNFSLNDTETNHNPNQKTNRLKKKRRKEMDKLILKLIWKSKRNRTAKTILKEKNKFEEHIQFDYKLN